MHEMSLAQSIVEIVEGISAQNDGRKVASVTLTIGELAGVELPALMQGLRIASDKTVMEGADIRINRPEGTAWCMACCKTVPYHRLGDACPGCGGYQLQVNGGKDFKVSRLELEN